ncbi:MAG: AAA family ATPase [Pseudanabaenaceae cyanobacterium bins.68]|nr:AAA family ATPase [Pseudanabaenaceae cyanobacterium bins.68]
MQEQLNILIQAKYPLIYTITPEEERAEKVIAAIAKPNQKLYTWTVTRGMVEYGQNSPMPNTLSPEAALAWITRSEAKESAIYIFKDLHPFKDSPAVTRWLRDAIASFKETAKTGCIKTIILLSPVQEIPVELEKEVVVLDFPLPTLEELEQVLNLQLGQQPYKRLPPDTKEKLLRATLGLTHDEAEKVYRKAQVTAGKLTADEVEIVLSEKKQLIRRNRILEYIEQEEGITAVGGLEELKHWLTQRADSFSQKAREYGLPQPKGMLILGVPGCGKSLIAKTTARLWSLPLVRLDMGRVYDGTTVGRSEANLRNALKSAESISPMILFIDELDKAFAGSGGSADADGGTSSRIFGTFLTWMQEKQSPVFVMATANRVDRLPGEFLRKGRFDEIFFVDLPNHQERSSIFGIHLQKRRSDISRFDLAQLANVSDGFSGAEIEQAVIAAMYEAFAQDREFTQLDIISAVKSTTPLSRTMNEQVASLREWARLRARPAATTVAEYQRMEF